MWTVLTAVWSVSCWVSQLKKISPNSNTTQYLQILPSTQLPNASIVLTLDPMCNPNRPQCQQNLLEGLANFKRRNQKPKVYFPRMFVRTSIIALHWAIKWRIVSSFPCQRGKPESVNNDYVNKDCLRFFGVVRWQRKKWSCSSKTRTNVVLDFLIDQRTEVSPDIIMPCVKIWQQLVQVSTQCRIDGTLHQRQTFLQKTQSSLTAN